MATLYLATDLATRTDLQRRYSRGEFTRVRNGIYVDTHDGTEMADTILREWIAIANFLFTNPIAIYRTASELRPHDNRVYLMVANGKRRTVVVGPLKLTVEAGDIVHGIEPFDLNMQRSNVPRQLLENLTSARTKVGFKMKLGHEWVESQLVEEVTRRGEAGLNQLRDEAATLAPLLGYTKQYEQLNKMVSAMLKTHPGGGVLATRAGIAHAAGEPYDRERLTRFSLFSNYLAKLDLSTCSYTYNIAGWRNLTFFESYFSNYIEGTRFSLEEAEEIVSSGRAMYERHEDSHDLLAHIEISGDPSEMTRVPNSTESFIDLLKSRHRILLAQRPGKRPGEFKNIKNQAGATDFVLPEQVEGTLAQGFPLYQQMPMGIKRAIFMHFLVAEVHPFDDGNGRLARIMMNAELVATDQHKIIVPTVCRENYLDGLRQATRHNRFRTICKVLHQVQQYSASINWRYYNDAKTQLQTHAADQEANEGMMTFNKQLSKYTGDYQADG